MGEIGTFTRGNGLQKADFVDSGFPCIHYGQIYTRYGLSTNKTITYCSKELAKKLVKAKTGDMIIACTSENIEDVCKAVVWLGEGEVATGGHSCVFSHNQDPKYVAYFFQTEQFFMQKKKYANGVKVIDIKAVDLAKISIPIPSLSEQQRIVSILDTFTSSISNLKQQIEERRKQYEYERDLLLDLEGKEGVEMKKLGEVCTFSQGIQVPVEQQILEKKEGYCRFLRIIDFTQGEEPPRYVPISDKNYYVDVDDIAMVRYGSPGFVCVGKRGIIANNLFKVNIINSDFVTKLFLACLLKSKLFQKQIKQKSLGGALQAISFGLLRNIILPFPPLSTQSRIVSILDTFEQSIANLEEQLAMREKQYEYYREKLLRFEEA